MLCHVGGKCVDAHADLEVVGGLLSAAEEVPLLVAFDHAEVDPHVAPVGADGEVGPLGDVKGAIEMLEPAAEQADALTVVAEPLADLYQRAGRDDDLILLCKRAGAGCEAVLERSDWYLRMGDAQRRQGDHASAAGSYQQVLAERPDDRNAPSALRDIYRHLGETEPLDLSASQALRSAIEEYDPSTMLPSTLLRTGRTGPAVHGPSHDNREERARAEEERRRLERVRVRAQEERARMEEEMRRTERERAARDEEHARMENERRRVDKERARLEQERARAQRQGTPELIARPGE